MRCESCDFDLPEGSRFCSQCGMPTTEQTVERRPLTVFIFDLVGYTELASELDPEDVQRTIRLLNDSSTRVIQEYGGVIARYAGDGSLAYFGVPSAHDDDACRAIDAGLALADATQHLEVGHALPIRTRIGIATGEVVVGDVLSHGPARELTAHGRALPMAARLQTLASPDQVVVCQATRNLAAGYFDFESLGSHTLKGFSRPIPAWRAVARRAVEGRFAARSAPGAPLMGRRRECGAIEKRLRDAMEGRGGFVLVTGEAGIGKSRVVADVRASLGETVEHTVYLQCSADHQASAFHPVLENLRLALSRLAETPGASQTDRVRELLGSTSPDAHRLADVTARMLGLAEADDPAIEAQMKADFTTAMLDRVETLCRSGTTLLVLEDAHWIDPSTSDLLARLIGRIADRPLLVLVTSRESEGIRGQLGPEALLIELERLQRPDAQALVESMGAGGLPAATVASIVDRSAGVPLFLEELTRAALDAGAEAVPASASQSEMPLLIRDALVVRLDRLGSARRVARTASALGREFSRGLLAAVCAVMGQQLTDSLSELERAGVLERQPGAQEATWIFRHDLLRSAAYDLMLRDERADLHARIASAMETQFTELADREPEQLARHYSEAGLFEQSVRAWVRAGRRASGRSSFAEAVRAYENAVELVDELPDRPSRDELELAVRLGLGEAHAGDGGFASAPAGAAYDEALRKAEELGDNPSLLRAYTGLFSFHHMGGRLDEAQAVAERFRVAAEMHGDVVDRLASHRVLGVTAFTRAEHDFALRHLETALELYDDASPKDLERATLNAQDQKTTTLCYLPLIFACQGDPDRAMAVSRQGIEHSEQLGHLHSIGYSLTFAAGLAAMLKGRESELADLSDRAMAFAGEEGFPNWRMARVFHGLARAEMGEVEVGLETMRSGFASYGSNGSLIYAPLGMRHLARAQVLAGQLDEAIETLDRGLGIMDMTGEVWCRPWLLLEQGELHARLGQKESAAAAFQRSLEHARPSSARLFELRAATGLARLRSEEGRQSEALALVTRVCAGFDEAVSFPELEYARTLLREVA